MPGPADRGKRRRGSCIVVDMTQPLAVTFCAGGTGAWAIERIVAIRGEALPAAARLDMALDIALDMATGAPAVPGEAWRLRGVVSNTRYTTASELKTLAPASPPLGRPEATCAALIPIGKSAAWWAMAQDERRQVFEERSGHIARSLRYLPAVARRLHHARDLGGPFDFLTWFEFAPENAPAFDALLADLRASEEWNWVEREVEVRLRRA